eukprot:scaffold8212_cov93-Cylindrotheca_fusiformis.AAC.13
MIRVKAEANGAVTCHAAASDTKVSIVPRESDIIFGRGKRNQDHSGNIRMREFVVEYKHLYSVLKRYEKQALVENLYEMMVQRGARFLRKDEEMDIWVIVDREQAVKKVSHALRCKRHLNKPPSKSLQVRTANRWSPSKTRPSQDETQAESQVPSTPPRAAPFKAEPQLVQSLTTIPPSSPSSTTFRLSLQNERTVPAFPFSGSNYMTLQSRNQGTIIALEDLKRREFARRHQLMTMLEIERHQAQRQAASALYNVNLLTKFY